MLDIIDQDAIDVANIYWGDKFPAYPTKDDVRFAIGDVKRLLAEMNTHLDNGIKSIHILPIPNIQRL